MVSALRTRGKRLLFLTNNSTSSRRQYVDKFAKLGMSVRQEEIVCSAFVAGFHLRERLRLQRPVYVVGMDGLCEELSEAGVRFFGALEHRVSTWASTADLRADDLAADVGAVLVGLDVHFNYRKLFTAQAYLQRADCLFLATNDDRTFPYAGGLAPGAGAMVAAIAAASGRRPTVLGKPHDPTYDCIARLHHLDAARTCMVGDRLDTDIAFGRRHGLQTLLVYSGPARRGAARRAVSRARSSPCRWCGAGVTTPEQAAAAPADAQPDYCIDTVAGLLAGL